MEAIDPGEERYMGLRGIRSACTSSPEERVPRLKQSLSVVRMVRPGALNGLGETAG